MDEVKQYKTAGAFRTALETRLQTRAQVERTDLQRLRRQVAFDRFLARLFPKGPKGTYPWILKGGYAMELRIRSARTTKDIDLTPHDGTRLAKSPDERGKQVRVMLQDARLPGAARAEKRLAQMRASTENSERDSTCRYPGGIGTTSTPIHGREGGLPLHDESRTAS